MIEEKELPDIIVKALEERELFNSKTKKSSFQHRAIF